MEKNKIIAGGVAIVIAVAFWAVYARVAKAPVTNTCAADTQLCPDGSFVNRVGPECTFAKCPPVGSSILPYTSGVQGTVTIGPICPVMKNPPSTACADAPYATTIVVYKTGSDLVFTTTVSTTTGAFKVTLPPGTYSIKAGGTKLLPRCAAVTTNVSPNTFAKVAISCDTGIR